MVDAGASGIGGRTYTIAPITSYANDLVWFDYMFAHNSQPFLFSGVVNAKGSLVDQTTLPLPADIEFVLLRFIYYSPVNATDFWYVFRIA